MKRKINIVLYSPEIPQNTGNIARTCSVTGAALHLIKPLGFEITVGGKTVGPDVIKCTKVYASMVEDGTPLAAPEGYYYFTFVITGVADNTSFDVKACATVNGTNYVTAVGTCVYPPVEA